MNKGQDIFVKASKRSEYESKREKINYNNRYIGYVMDTYYVDVTIHFTLVKLNFISVKIVNKKTLVYRNKKNTLFSDFCLLVLNRFTSSILKVGSFQTTFTILF